MITFPGNEASVVAVFVQAVLYGVYISTLAFCLRWLLYADEGWRHRQKINWSILTITILLAVFSTFDLGISLQLTIAIVMDWNPTALNILNTISGAFELTTMIIADAVLIYRCWMVYGKSKIAIAFPFIVWAANAACSAILVALYAFIVNQTQTIKMAVSPWLFYLWLIFYSCNITVNVYATAAIIYRILRVAQSNSSTRSGLYKIIRILAESGILYTVSTAMNLIMTVIALTGVLAPSQITALKLTFDAINFSMAGIAFNLILIRVGQGRVGSDNSKNYSADSRYDTKPLSTLQFHGPNPTIQDESSDLNDINIERRTRGWTNEVEMDLIGLRAEEIAGNPSSVKV